jgi:hypothetical protein
VFIVFSIKEGVNIYELLSLDSRIITLLGKISEYCEANKMKAPVITSIKGDRKGVRAKSKTHEDFRAIDLRIFHWNECQVGLLVIWLNTKFSSMVAISSSDGEV